MNEPLFRTEREKQESALRCMTMLLHYHERMTLGKRDDELFRPYQWCVLDPWRSALEEAISCMKKCYGMDGLEEEFVL